MTTQAVPDRLSLPPPLELDLVDAGHRIGWIAGDVVGFRGFADETEAAHAAWIAHRTLLRRLARTHGTRPVPIDIEPLTLGRTDDKEAILASDRWIGNLVRPGADSRSGVDSFGFELTLPSPTTELQARALAYLVYRTLRKSGVRWAMWRPAARRAATVARSSVEAAREVTRKDVAETGASTGRAPRRGWGLSAVSAWLRRRSLTRAALAPLSHE